MVDELNNHRPQTIRDLYPDMTDEELAEAANLKQYVAEIVHICDRLKAEGKTWPPPEDSSGRH